MTQWIETKLRYDKMQETGAIKKVTEVYLVDALTFAEAEARIADEMKTRISGEFNISAVKKSKIGEIFRDQGGSTYFMFKVGMESVNEKTGQMKTTPVMMLVLAYDIEEAIEHFKDGMGQTMADYRILSIAETPIMDIYPCE